MKRENKIKFIVNDLDTEDNVSLVNFQNKTESVTI